MTSRHLVAWAYVGLVLAFLFAPVVVMVLFAFNGINSESILDGFSLGAYNRLFADPHFFGALWNSLKAAAITGVFGGIVGTVAALGLSKLSGRILAALSLLFVVPLTIPGLFIGVALLGFLSKMGFEMSLFSVVMGHIVVNFPLIVLIVAARLQRIDLSVVEAARDLGAGPLLAFRRVLFPMMAPAVIGSVLLAVAGSLDEFIITLFVNGGDYTVPVYIFGQLRFGLTTSVNAAATIMLTISTVLAVVATRYISVRDIALRTGS